MRLLSRFSIGVRIFVVLGLMAALTIGVSVMGVNGLDRYEAQSNTMTAVSERAMLSLKTNALVNQMVGDTRAVYTARNADEMKIYATDLAKVIKETEALVDVWQSKVPPESLEAFDKQVKQPLVAFIKSRQAIAKVADEESPISAQLEADREDYRDLRLKIAATLVTVSDRNAKSVEEMNTALSVFYNTQRPTMIWGSAAGLVVVLALALLIVLATITRPIGGITAAMRQLATGDLETRILGAERRDEIGAMAKAVGVFKDNMVARAEAEAQIEAQRSADETARAERAAREQSAITEISQLCDRIAAGDLNSRLDEAGKEGFLLSMSQQLNSLAAMLQTMTGELASITSALAEGSLDRNVTGDYAGVFGELKQSVNGMAATLRDFATRLGTATHAVRDASSEISAGSQDLAQRTESQAASIEETAASMQEITATVKQNAENAQAANQLATTARETANKGGSIVGEAVRAMAGIEDSARKISEIMALIDEIAFQTNLLALNASVEAARAGEAGKGFAVVAQEVRSLAQRSAGASKDIKSLIGQSNSQVRQGASLVQQAGASLEDIVSAVKKVADIVAEIAAASQEQATGLDQINTAVASMDETTQRNGALVEETSAAAQALSSQAEQLSRLVAFFRLGNSAGKPAAAAQPAIAAKTTYAAKPAVLHKPATLQKPAAAALKRPALKVAGGTTVAAAARPADDGEWAEF
ncbi:methyl-accepting chemotaxis protein [Ferrovibrio sp.]|uniref:methyl-accepting chemotaxis protein n=1 Tax=Ferrovibrio sp. TaxID=1917215 RepID=UPI001B7782BC|nr:methyl-accepting chemotaxis protein [Ferrovibrio sp.]MBP7063469.1 HAMP domain-containing protein [Ferrovibrio sp.]